MTRSPRNLSKHDVEQMMAAVGGPSASALEEITVMRAALGVALVNVLAMPELDPEADLVHPTWTELVTVAAQQGRWNADRRLLLARAEHPDRATDPEAVLDALWDLAQELNERRTIAPLP